MNKEDIIRTLRESCDKDKQDAWQNGFWVITQEELERFATLVVASIDPSKFMSWQEGYEAGVTAEREACAELIPPQYFELRDRIRARGQA